jgi:hypothetical protein
MGFLLDQNIELEFTGVVLTFSSLVRRRFVLVRKLGPADAFPNVIAAALWDILG